MRSPWTYTAISALCLYIGCLRGMYVNLFAEPRAAGSGEITRARIHWFDATIAVASLLTLALTVAGITLARHARGRRRSAGLGVVIGLLAALAVGIYVALLRPIRVSWLPFMTGLHGFGPYAFYELILTWGLLSALAGFSLFLLLRRPPGRRRGLYYAAAAGIVVLAIIGFVVAQLAMTAPLAVASADDVWRVVRTYAGYAGWTLLFWVVLFVAVDRWNPQRPIVWFLALGWGAGIAPYVSMFLNTWVAEMMAVSTTGPGVQAAAAMYSAPFVEESAKATVLFLIAAALRYRLISRQSIFALAGLSAAGFAFTENIIYYVRAFSQALQDPTVSDPKAAAFELVLLRGLYTAFGHEGFTALTAIGLTTAVMARSKTVRILAPVTGFLGAAFGHMLFNGSASVVGGGEDRVKWIYLGIGIAVVAVMIGVSVLNATRDGRRIRARLQDYVVMGWLRPTDPSDFGTLSGRWTALWRAVATRRPSRVFATISMIRSMTELAFLRDAMCRGLINDAGLEREKEVLAKIRGLRGQALDRSSRVSRGRAAAPAFAATQAAPGGYPGPDRPWGRA